MATDPQRRVLAVIPDLFFLAKVTATAHAAGIALETATPHAAPARAAASAPALVLVDLHVPGMPALVRALKAAAPAAQLAGFYSHVAVAIRDAALAAGADAAMPRSQFVTRLPALLERGLAPAAAAAAAAPKRGRLLEAEAQLTKIARDLHTVAVVGIKDASDPDAPAYDVPRLLADSGVRLIGINPRVPEAFGERTLASVAELAEAPDVVNVFRRPAAIPELAAELLALPPGRRAPVVWLQTGIRHDEAAASLVAGGYDVVQDRCLGVYRRRARRPILPGS